LGSNCRRYYYNLFFNKSNLQMKTAIDKLKEILDGSGIHLDKKLYSDFKELEKQQIIDAVNSQRQVGWDEKGEDYYSQTYKQE